MKTHSFLTVSLVLLSNLLVALTAAAQAPTDATPAPVKAEAASAAEAEPEPKPESNPESDEDGRWHLGAHAELDVGILLAMKQGAAFAGGVVYGPFRAGMSYATFLSNPTFGGTPYGFSLRANYIVGVNASYFIAQSTDEGFYVQAMLHIKEQGVTNDATGDHKDLSSIASGLELGYVWKVYRGLYVAPRVGALYYFKSPQGSDNRPVQIGDRSYDNGRHKIWDTYFIPTLSVGYSW